MIWCKNCPRCNGDLLSQSDVYGEFISCLQCGCILNEQQGRAIKLEAKPPHYREVISELRPPQRQLTAGGQTRRAA